MKKEYLIMGALSLVIAVSAFFGGMQYQQAQNRAQFAQFATGNRGARFQNGNGAGATNRPISGTILDTSAQNITVKTQDGGSKIVFFSDQTKTYKTTTAAITDLVKDDEVTIFGNTASDGTYTAIQILTGKVMGMPNRMETVPATSEK